MTQKERELKLRILELIEEIMVREVNEANNAREATERMFKWSKPEKDKNIPD